MNSDVMYLKIFICILLGVVYGVVLRTFFDVLLWYIRYKINENIKYKDVQL